MRLLLGQARRPVRKRAFDFYDKDEPVFLSAHSDGVGLILTGGLMAGVGRLRYAATMFRLRKANFSPRRFSVS